MDSQTLRAAQLFIEMGLSSLTTIVWTPSDQIAHNRLTLSSLEYARENLDFLQEHLDPDLQDPDLLESLDKFLSAGNPDSIPENIILDVKKVIRIGFIQAYRIFGLKEIETEEEAQKATKRYEFVRTYSRENPGSKKSIEKLLWESLISEWENKKKAYKPGQMRCLTATIEHGERKDVKNS